MEFEKVNPALLLGMLGIIIMGVYLIYTRQDGLLLKYCFALLGLAMGLPLTLPDFFKGKGRE